MGFIIGLIIVVGVRLSLTLILGNLNVNDLYINILADFVLALIFSLFNYNYSARKNAWKDILFHKQFAIAFAILATYSCLTGIYFVVR